MKMVIRVPQALDIDCDIIISDLNSRLEQRREDLRKQLEFSIKLMGGNFTENPEKLQEEFNLMRDENMKNAFHADTAIKSAKLLFSKYNLGLITSNDFGLHKLADKYYIVQDVTIWQYIKSHWIRNRKELKPLILMFFYSILLLIVFWKLKL